MDRGLKQMLWMSWTLRCRTLCLNYAVPNHVSHGTSQNYWTYSKDTNWSQNLEPLKKIMQDSQTHTANDLMRILDTIDERRPTMELKDTLDILIVLAEIAREDRQKIDFMNHKGFQILCEKLKKQIRLMSLNEVLQCLKILTFLNVPASTVLMQNLLQIIRTSLNDLQIDQIHLLLTLLKKMETTSLSSALLIALPIVLPNILDKKLNYDDLRELSIALFCMRFEGRQDIIIKICRHMQRVMRENPNVPTNLLVNIFTSFCNISIQNHGSDVLLDTIELVRKRLLYKAYRITSVDVEECLKALNYSIRNGNMILYDNTFVTGLLDVAISRGVDFHIGCRILAQLNSIHYAHVPFLKYLLNKTLPIDISNFQLNMLLNAFCISDDYEPIPWTYIEKRILQPTFQSNATSKNLLHCAMYLAALDKYYPDLISTVFTNANLRDITSTKYYSTNLLYLYQGVKALYSEYKGPWPSEESLAYIYESTYSPNKRSVLMNQVEIAMGGPQYVLTNLRTKIGHIIDCAIIMRKGGYPIAFNTPNSEVLANYNSYVEELQCPPESYVILIVELPSIAYSINTKRLLNVKKLQLKSLEKWTGHECIVINLKIWESLPKHEKISHIMEKIRNKCNDIKPNL